MLNLLKSIQIIYSLQNWDWKFSVTFTRRRCWKLNGIHSSEIRDLCSTSRTASKICQIFGIRKHMYDHLFFFNSLLLYFSLMDEIGEKLGMYLMYLYSKNIANLEAFIQGITSSTNLLYFEERIDSKYIKSRYCFIYLSHI